MSIKFKFKTETYILKREKLKFVIVTIIFGDAFYGLKTRNFVAERPNFLFFLAFKNV